MANAANWLSIPSNFAWRKALPLPSRHVLGLPFQIASRSRDGMCKLARTPFSAARSRFLQAELVERRQLRSCSAWKAVSRTGESSTSSCWVLLDHPKPCDVILHVSGMRKYLHRTHMMLSAALGSISTAHHVKAEAEHCFSLEPGTKASSGRQRLRVRLEGVSCISECTASTCVDIC